MNISPLDIRKHEFKKSIRGFDPDEVVTFLDMISIEFENLIRENSLMKEKIVALKCEEWGIEPTPEDVKVYSGAIKPAFINEFQRKVTIAVFGAAKAAGRMVA